MRVLVSSVQCAVIGSPDLQIPINWQIVYQSMVYGKLIRKYALNWSESKLDVSDVAVSCET